MLTKDISCAFKCRFDGKKCNSVQWWNDDKCQCKCKNCHVCEKYYIWDPSPCSCKNGKHLASIIDNSVISCDAIIDTGSEAMSYDET